MPDLWLADVHVVKLVGAVLLDFTDVFDHRILMLKHEKYAGFPYLC